jgi:hypothetical protein
MNPPKEINRHSPGHEKLSKTTSHWARSPAVDRFYVRSDQLGATAWPSSPNAHRGRRLCDILLVTRAAMLTGGSDSGIAGSEQ